MVMCQFFLRGGCKFGDRCRNEHPGGRSQQGSVFAGSGTTGGFGGSAFTGSGGNTFDAAKKNVCQFFLKGTCRYGNNCRFAHIKPAGQGMFGGQANYGQNRNTPVFGVTKNVPFNRNQNRFGVLGNEVAMGTAGTQQNSTEAILQNPTQMNQVQQIVKRDMEAWDASKQWPLSCYTYLKDEPCLVGLVDFSPEEIRKEAYDAKLGNKVSAYEQGLKSLIERSRQRRLELKNMDVHQLQIEIRASVSRESASNMSIQSSGQPSSMFSGPASMNQPQNVIGSPAPANQSSGLFGSTSPLQQQMGSGFGTSSMTTSNTGIFGSTSPSQPSSLFGTSPAPQNTGLFGTTSTINPGTRQFGAATNNTSPFGKQPTAAGSSLFGATSTSQPAMNVFGNQASGQPSSASGVAPSTCPLTCSEQDIAAFKADKFVLGQIPECPPPPEFCS